MMELTRKNIEAYAARYDQKSSLKDKHGEFKFKRLLAVQRFLTKSQLVKIGVWKSARQKQAYADNDAKAVKELTEFSFAATTEHARIGALRALNGVDFPVASVILHFAFPDRYPILDFRALWSLGWPKPSTYNLKFWLRYCSRLRKIAAQFGLPLRIVEEALWQYSRDHQAKS